MLVSELLHIFEDSDPVYVVPRTLGEIVLDFLARQGPADWRTDPDIKASTHVQRQVGSGADSRNGWE